MTSTFLPIKLEKCLKTQMSIAARMQWNGSSHNLLEAVEINAAFENQFGNSYQEL